MDNFQVEKVISFPEKNLLFKILVDNKTLKNDNQKAIFIQYQSKSYLLPLWSNSFRSYWNFKNEPNESKIASSKAKFEDQLKRILEDIESGNEQKTGIDWFVLDKLFEEVLICRKLELDTNIHIPRLLSQRGMNLYENDNQELFEKNVRDIYKYKDDDSITFYFDESNYRVYGVKFKTINRSNNPIKIELINYRFEYLLRLMNL